MAKKKKSAKKPGALSKMVHSVTDPLGLTSPLSKKKKTAKKKAVKKAPAAPAKKPAKKKKKK